MVLVLAAPAVASCSPVPGNAKVQINYIFKGEEGAADVDNNALMVGVFLLF